MQMNHEIFKRRLAIAFAIFASVFGVFYMIFLALFFFRGPLEVFLSLIFVFLIIIAAIFNGVGVIYYHDSYYYKENAPKKQLKRMPSVAIAVTSFNESPAMIEHTIRSVKRVEYPKDKIKFYLVDDSEKPENVGKLKRICKREGVILIHRKERANFKAGALNNFLGKTDAEYAAIFDADETLVDAKFLLDNLPYFVGDEKLLCLQTIKTSSRGSAFANAINETYQFFVRFIQPLRSRDKVAMFQGSAGIIRASIAKKMGGFPNSITEDTALSFYGDLKGYHSIFINKLYVVGKPIETYAAFATQQYRYSFGNSALVRDYFRNFWRFKGGKRMHYFAQVFGLHYISMVYILFALLTVAFALLGVSQVIFSGSEFWKFGPKVQFSDLFPFGITMANILVISIFFFSSLTHGIIAYFLNFATALIRARAAIDALLQKSPHFKVVDKTLRLNRTLLAAARATLRESSFALSLLLFSFSAFLHADVVGGLWLSYYFLLFSSAFIFAYMRG